MKIIKLQAQNIKRLKAVEITPDGNVIKISGKNAAGKSSILDAIEIALSGKKAAAGEPLRKGQSKGQVVLDLGEFIITRKFTEKGGSLVVETKDGFERKSPQAFLDDLVGKVSFDPMAFINMPAVQQRKVLLEFTGLDLDKLDEVRKEKYDTRTSEARYLKQMEANLTALPVPDNDTPSKETNVVTLIKKLEAANEHNSTYDDILQTITDKDDEIAGFVIRCENLKDQISNTKELLLKYDKELDQAKIYLNESQADLPKLHKDRDDFEEIDDKPIRLKIKNIGDFNKKVQDKKAWEETKSKVDAQTRKVGTLTRGIDKIDEEKTEAVENANLPIKGLSFSEAAVLYNGIELANIASSERIRVAVAVSMALNPKLKVLRITDGSLLDGKSLDIITKMVKKNDYQIWIEVVDDSGKVGFYIEDGSIK